MAVIQTWDGSTLPAISGTVPESATIDSSIGDPAPSFRFVGQKLAYIDLASLAPTAPSSIRFRHRAPELTTSVTGLRFLRLHNLRIGYHNSPGAGLQSMIVHFFGGATPASETFTVTAGAWVTVEVNVTSTTAGRARIWDDAGTLLYDRSHVFTALAGGWLGTGGASSNTTIDRLYHIDSVTITDTAADVVVPGDPEVPAPTLGLRVHEGAAWVEHPVKVHDGAAWVQVPARWYGGPGWVAHAERIDAATTIADVQAVLTDVAAMYQVTITVAAGTGVPDVGVAASFGTVSTIDDGYLRPAAKALAAALTQYPTTRFRNGAGGPDNWKFYLGRNLTTGGVEASGLYASKRIYINTDTTDYGLSTTTTSRYDAVLFAMHHELAHGLWEQMTGPALTTYASEMAAANPPGFVYLGADAKTAPYEGEHPPGFPRAYSRTNADEDQADIVGWVLTGGLWGRDGSTWFAADPYLAAKATAARKWLTSLGFTGL